MSTPSLQWTGRVRDLAAPGSPIAERVLAGALLLTCLPVLILVMAAVALVSRKSPLIAHRRVGRFGQEFWMLKLRTMWDRRQAPRKRESIWVEYLRDTHVPAFKGDRDPRVTSPLARLCRRFSLDELPQLLHVISGKMRLVGPRPITREEWDEHYGPSAAEVLSALPGMTGMWQVVGRNRLTYAQRRRLDLFYVRRRSWRLDLRLLLRTPARVLSGRGAG